MRFENRPCEHCERTTDQRGEEAEGSGGNIDRILWTCTVCGQSTP